MANEVWEDIVKTVLRHQHANRILRKGLVIGKNGGTDAEKQKCADKVGGTGNDNCKPSFARCRAGECALGDVLICSTRCNAQNNGEQIAGPKRRRACWIKTEIEDPELVACIADLDNLRDTVWHF